MSSARTLRKRKQYDPSHDNNGLGENPDERKNDLMETLGRDAWERDGLDGKVLDTFNHPLANWAYYPRSIGRKKDVKTYGIAGTHYALGYKELGEMVAKQPDYDKWPRITAPASPDNSSSDNNSNNSSSISISNSNSNSNSNNNNKRNANENSRNTSKKTEVSSPAVAGAAIHAGTSATAPAATETAAAAATATAAGTSAALAIVVDAPVASPVTARPTWKERVGSLERTILGNENVGGIFVDRVKHLEVATFGATRCSSEKKLINRIKAIEDQFVEEEEEESAAIVVSPTNSSVAKAEI